jgi:hypothetical protein
VVCADERHVQEQHRYLQTLNDISNHQPKGLVSKLLPFAVVEVNTG